MDMVDNAKLKSNNAGFDKMQHSKSLLFFIFIEQSFSKVCLSNPYIKKIDKV